METEEAARELRLAEQEIARQAFAEKNQRIEELQKKVELLEGLLNQAHARQWSLPQPQPLPSYPAAKPRRWSVR